MFGLLKSSIIAEYQQVIMNMLAKVDYLLTRDGYLSDRQIYELKDKEFRQALEAEKSKIFLWSTRLWEGHLFCLEKGKANRETSC